VRRRWGAAFAVVWVITGVVVATRGAPAWAATLPPVRGPELQVDLPLTDAIGLFVDDVTGRVVVVDADRVRVFDRWGRGVGEIGGMSPAAAAAWPGFVATAQGPTVSWYSVATLAPAGTATLPSGAIVRSMAASGPYLYVSWSRSFVGLPTDPFGFSRVPLDGSAVTSWVVSDVYPLLRADPDHAGRLFTRTGVLDVSAGAPAVVPPASGCEFHAESDVAVLPGTGKTYTAVGGEYYLPERSADQCATGFRHLTGAYPRSVDATERFGGVVAAAGSYFDGAPVQLFRPGAAQPFVRVGAARFDDAVWVRLAHDAPLAYAVVRYWTGEAGVGYLWRLQIVSYGPASTLTVAGLDCASLSTLGDEDVTVNGLGLSSVTAAAIDGRPVSVVSQPNDLQLTFRTPAHAAGTGTLTLTSPFGSQSIPLPFTPTMVGYGEFHPATPVRVIDTRSDVALVAGVARRVRVAGVGPIPADHVLAVVANVTVTEPQASGYLTVWPSGRPTPLASNLNFVSGETVPNLVTAGVGADGAILVEASVGTHVVIDLVGWYGTAGATPGSRFHPMAPRRVVDTREIDGGGLGPRGIGWLTLRGSVVPANASAVVMNVTVVDASAPTFVTVFPATVSGTIPLASNLNVDGPAAVPNLVVSRLDGERDLYVYNNAGRVQLIFDVVGWFDDDRTTEAGRFVPLAAPVRFLDSRTAAPIAGGHEAVVGVAGRAGIPPPPVARAVVANATVTEPSLPVFVTVHPGGSALPATSTLNASVGQTVPNHVLMGLGPSGDVGMFVSQGTAHLLLDVAGWFTGAAASADDVATVA
jgi:hypothetical protein